MASQPDFMLDLTFIQGHLDVIIPHPAPKWQEACIETSKYTWPQISHETLLDSEWQTLQLAETCLLRLLERDWEAIEHDLIFARLGQIRQRMTEIQQQLEGDLDWAINGYGGDDDEW